MLLEKQLLCNCDDDEQDGPRPKRARTSHQPIPETTATWVELSKYVVKMFSNSALISDSLLFN